MGIYTDAVQKLYVAYFNRPADAAGLTFWEGVVAAQKGSTAAVSAAFAGSAEYKAAYAGMDAYSVVATVYQNLFGHAPDLPGLTFWGQGLLNKVFTVDTAVTEIAKGAQGTDLAAYNNKVAAATAFTLALDTPAEVLGYNGDAANLVAKNWLSTIGSDAAGLAAAITTAALNATVQSVVDAHDGTTGKSFTLTAGLDTVIGTTGNDVINAYGFDPASGDATTNLSSFDSIDGGAGKDTLNLDLTNGKNTITGTIKNVEIVNVTGGAAAVDASAFVGATNVNVIGGVATVNNLAAGSTAGFQGTTGDLTVSAAGASAAVSLNNIAETAAINVSGTKLASVTVSGTRADTDASGAIAQSNLNITAGTDVQAITVTTNASTRIVIDDTASTKKVTSVDASASTGVINFTGDADVLTIKTGTAGDTVTIAGLTAAATSSAAAKNASVVTGDGKDVITVSTTGDGSTSVDAGTGDDTITVTKVAGNTLSILGADGNDSITVNGVLATSDIVDGGAGTDTIAMAGAATRSVDDYIVFNKLLKNFETIKFTGAAEGALDASQLAANYTTVDLSTGSVVSKVGAQALVANGNLTATAAGYVAGDTYAGSLNITEKAGSAVNTGTITANADVLTLAVKAASSNGMATTLAGDVQSATISLTNSVNSTSNPTIDRIASVTVDTTTDNHDGLKSLTLNGNGSATVVNAAGSKLTMVDASALGGTLTAGVGATQGLTYTSVNAAVETIKLGSGIDHITIGASTYGKVDVIQGLNLALNSAGTALSASSDTLAVTGVATTITKFTTTQTDLDLALKDAAASSKGNDLVFTMNGDTYIFHDGGNTSALDAGDIVVKLVGIVDPNAVIVALGGTPV
jgi:hypothetical protein